MNHIRSAGAAHVNLERLPWAAAQPLMAGFAEAGDRRGFELESSATEDEFAAEMTVAKTTTVAAFIRRPP
jgi:hypothetical protein